ncbi:MAG: kinase/pyrophosphorylase [Gammaproteobacteria bacterium]|nr:kinase/pyrophosphorylase [Gammaproteobacteria bacterium]
MTMDKRTVFFVSDSTAITVERLGRSLLSQFEGIEFQTVSLRYINSVERAQQASARIKMVNTTGSTIVFASLLDEQVRHEIKNSADCYIDIFELMMQPLEQVLGKSATGLQGQTHKAGDENVYARRMDAVNYALRYDDGLGDKLNGEPNSESENTGYQKADVILLGVSRTGKTPTCLYLALEYGIYAANYPLTEDDRQMTNSKQGRLPPALEKYRNKLFGLTIDPLRLAAIRRQRKTGQHYATAEICQLEVAWAEQLFRTNHLPLVDTTTISVEEIATRILAAIQKPPA